MTIKNIPAAPITARMPSVRSEVSARAKEEWQGEIRAASPGDNEISILDVIGADFWGEGVTAKRIAAALRQIGDQDVIVNINSPGGDVFEGLAIYSLLREHKAKVTVRVLGLAASAASVIAMAGDEIQIARAGFLMIHNTWVVAAGDRNALHETADMLEPFDAALADIYAAQSGIDGAEIRQMLDRETWIGGADAVEKGFADGLLPSDSVEKDEGDKPSALRRLDNALSRANMPRAERRELIKEITAMPSAGGKGMPGAAEAEVNNLDTLRLAAARLRLLRA